MESSRGSRENGRLATSTIFFAFLIGNVVIGYNVFSAWPFGRVTGLACNERCSKGLRLDRVPELMNERGDMRGLEIVEAETPVSFRIRKPQRDSKGPFGKGREGKGGPKGTLGSTTLAYVLQR